MAAPSTSGPATNVELKVEVQNLPRLDVTSASDPQVIVYSVDAKGKVEIGRTETAVNQESYKFVKGICTQYFFEREQRLSFEVWDIDTKTKNDYMGSVTCTLGQLMGAPGQKLCLKITGSGKMSSGGKVVIRGETVEGNNAYVHFTMAAQGLDKKDFLGKSDPFIVILKPNADKSFSPVHKTEWVYKNLNPAWKPFTLTSQQLCNGDRSRPIRFEVYDHDDDGSHDLIGVCEMTLADLEELSTKSAQKDVSLINPKKTSKKGYVNSGVLCFRQIRTEQIYSFLDFVAGGLELQFVAAIDFTGSNGNPRDPKSLHFQGNPGSCNAYTDAIWSVGNIVHHYDSDKLFPAYGFGAKMGGQVHFNFALNFNPQNPYCQDVDGILGAYRNAINNPGVELWGPTNFAPVINSVTALAQQAVASERQAYYVLMILTDGVISDLEETKSAIVELSKLPVSIIIIGVGNEDFSAMNALDSDDKLLKDRMGRQAERDMVQFVPMRNFTSSPEALAAEVLKEVPRQVTDYYRKRNVKPMPPRRPPTSTPSSPSLSTSSLPGTAPASYQYPSSPGHAPGSPHTPPQVQVYPPNMPPGAAQAGYPNPQAPQPGYYAAPANYGVSPSNYGVPPSNYGQPPVGLPYGQPPTYPNAPAPPHAPPRP